jgi:hypothetical protein
MQKQLIKYFIIFNNSWVKISQTKAEKLLEQKRKTVKLYDQNLNFDGFGFYPKKSK